MIYKGKLSKKTECFIHVIFWVLVGYFTFVKNPLYAQWVVPGLFFTTYALVFVGTFYFHYLVVMKRVFRSFQWQKLLAGLFISYLFFTGFRWLTEQVITELLFNRVNYINPTFLNYMLDNMHYSSMPIIFSSFLWFAIYFIRLQQYNSSILEENKNTEIKFLKAQINPHFLFNSLNNIYSMVYFQSEKSLPAIEKLSKIMLFTTYESLKEKIKLAEELNYIKAYIELEQLRHKETAFVQLVIDVQNENIEIPPFILSPLVENALKHGVTANDNPIGITLTANTSQLYLKVVNEIGTQKKDKLGGIGLDNLKKRLDIYFPGKHSLDIKKENNRFSAILQISLA